MTLERGREIESKADNYRKDGVYIDAAEQYSLAAFECFGDSVPSARGKTVSFGLELLLESCLCYAVAELQTRRENRASIGILIAEDILDRHPPEVTDSKYDQCRKAAWYEFIADFHVVGGIGNAKKWYTKAEEVYSRYDDPPISIAEQEHLNLFTFYRVVQRGVNGPDSGRNTPNDCTFSEWVSMKRSELPLLIESLIEDGAHWDEDREGA